MTGTKHLMPSRRRHFLALGGGLLCFLVIMIFEQGINKYFDSLFLADSVGYPAWASAVLNITQFLPYLVAGFLAGWISTTRGILVGFIVGIAGSMLYISGLIALHGTGISPNALLYLFAGSSQSALLTCVAGGTGQLIRDSVGKTSFSNKEMSDTV